MKKKWVPEKVYTDAKVEGSYEDGKNKKKCSWKHLQNQ